LWHPVLVAEQIGTLAAIARGPFIMQCGLGPTLVFWWVGSAKTPYQAGFAALHSSADRLK
jgi:alkanesulfonate monooxygenase SsuD/methylene tetrahydromethanopterin reductase-like flavin-dependent oxidoreductase (luciferase family)